jgi:N-acetylglucosamine-6-sulfatase
MVFLLAAALLATVAASACAGNVTKTQPNFVFVITDDQDLELDSLSYQSAVQEHFVNQGTTFASHYCTISICCPSRVSLLTGRAAHNTNVTDVSAPYGKKQYPKPLSRIIKD